MEPNKLEQDIQQKLQQRTIQPSANAWDRLDAMLTVAEQQAAPQEVKVAPAKKTNRNWLYMAAAFLLMLGGGFFLMNHEAEQNVINTVNTPQVVGAETEKPAYTDKGLAIENIKNTSTTPVYASANRKAKKNKIVSSCNCIDIQLEPNKEKQQEIAQTTDTPATETPQAQKRKLRVDPEALLASVEGRPVQGNSAVANINQPKLKVNANKLLDNVEGELNDSFRNKVLNSIEKNYNVVKSAVATRNLE